MSTADYPHLFAAGQIGVVSVAHRAVTAPMTRVSADAGGLANDLMRDHYRAFAEGGFGLIVSEGTYIDLQHSQGYKDQPGIATDAQAEAWSKITEAVHGAGAKMFLQLLHAGALTQANDYVDGTIGPSAVQPPGEQAPNYYGTGPYPIPHALELDEIEEIQAAFRDAARRAVAAGFDGIEIHGANGYLLHQFFSDTQNQRDDAYGGPAENRVRMHAQVLAAVKQGAGPDRPVGMRISQFAVNDFTKVWPDGVDDAKVIFGAMKEGGADYVHANAPPAPVAVFDSGRTLAGLARDFFDGTVVACGGLNDPAVAEALIASGDADFAAMAKGALADPAWPQKIGSGATPVPFDPGMTQPLATLQNTIDWRAANPG
ncbi:MAG: NADH:flavin oxidoreductase [Alphaproteobacteria bacterium]|nr:NADH:flavin oxidoreductase [Alphaproteobacteria bacterium]